MPTDRLNTSPPNTKIASGPKKSVISRAFFCAPSTEATIMVSEAIPNAVALITNTLRNLNAQSERRLMPATRKKTRRPLSIDAPHR